MTRLLLRCRVRKPTRQNWCDRRPRHRHQSYEEPQSRRIARTSYPAPRSSGSDSAANGHPLGEHQASAPRASDPRVLAAPSWPRFVKCGHQPSAEEQSSSKTRHQGNPRYQTAARTFPADFGGRVNRPAGYQRKRSLASGPPLLNSDVPGGIRTHGPKIRNLVLYPAELRRHHRTIAEILLA